MALGKFTEENLQLPRYVAMDHNAYPNELIPGKHAICYLPKYYDWSLSDTSSLGCTNVVINRNEYTFLEPAA